MKTKHLFLTAILLVFSVLVVAEPVDPMRALEVAEQFAPQSAKAKRIKSKTAPEQSYEIVYTHRMPNSDRAAFYVVKLGEKGFVIISADDVANPILGYSYTNSWPTSISAQGDTLLPPQVLSYLNDMALQIETAIEKYPNLESSEEWNNVGQKAVRKISARKSADALPDSVGPLLTTTWGQGQYYNALCPEDAEGEDGHVPTGCVATAMAQIINYWGQKEEIKTRGIHSYDCQYGNLTVNYDSTSYDFANMPDALTAKSTPEQIKAVAKLMYECGVAVNMLYSAGESASLNEDARAALINFYHFTPDLSIAERAYFSNVEWDNLLHNDIAQGKPVYYSGTQNNLGHSFVCDGYNATGYYHFNFGWGGLADGWYLTSAVSPNGVDFSNNQLVLVGIVPDNTGNVILGQTTGISTFTVDEPLEFYHLLGHNAYEGTNYINECNNHVLVKSADNATQLVLDILEHEDQNAIIYDGEWGTELRSLYAGQENDLSPIVSTNNALQINYLGNLHYSGFHFAITKDEGCRRVSNIVASVEITTVHLMWQENGNATQWEIEYGEKGFALGNGTRIVTESTRYDIIGLKKFTEYDIYIRSVCSVNDYGEWNKVSILSEAPYWTDVVTEQPEGYVEDADGNITISSAEGLAWFKHVMERHIEEGKINHKYNVTLVKDIHLGRYKWTKLPKFSGVFDGKGHRIDSIYTIEEDDSSVAFFDLIDSAMIKNVQLTNCTSRQINLLGSSSAAGLVCSAENSIIMNCFVSGLIEGQFSTAPLCAVLHNSYIINCVSNCILTGANNSMVGGIVADGLNSSKKGGIIRNCYSASLISREYNWAGSILGYAYDDIIENCYAFYSRDPLVNIGGGRNVYNNLAYINKTDSGLYLDEPIYFELDDMSYTNLKDILNAGVRKYNIEGLRLWVNDTLGINDGMPILGSEYIVSCPNIQNLIAKNIQNNDGEFGVQLSWDETGDATCWEIKYNIQDSINEVRISTLDNKIDIFGLTKELTYEFSVRPICDESHKGGWSEKVAVIIDIPYWVDVVTKEPEGYVEDENGNVHISSTEGLAWLISKVNGLNGLKATTFNAKTIYLEQDIDVSDYKWTALSLFCGVFNGMNHTIKGLYINEIADNQGFFGNLQNAIIMNTNLVNCYVRGVNQVGAFAGMCTMTQFINCVSQGKVIATDQYAGGIVGKDEAWSSISLCSSYGSVSAGNYVGGLAGAIYELLNCFSAANVNATVFGAGGLASTVVWKARNCYSIGNVSAWLYSGGLISTLVDKSSLENAYAIGDVSGMVQVLEGSFEGAMVGTTLGDVVIRYAYGRAEFNEHPLIGDPDVATTHHHRIISDTASLIIDSLGYTMLTPINVEGKNYSILLDALNAWVDANNSEGQYLHWVADTAGVNGGFPIFAEEDMKYIITFCNDDGTILQQDTLELCEMPEYRGEIPTKDSTEQYNYIFIGWDQEFVPVTKNVTYHAQYEETLNQYEVTFYNWDGTLLQSEWLNYGEWPTYYSFYPEREADAQYTYTFTGWTPEFDVVTGNQSYYAQYESTLNQYEINFYDWDGTLLQSGWYYYGDEPYYISATPERESDAQYTYTFSGWSPELDVVTGYQSYYAQYTSTLNQYEITFYDWDGSLLYSEMFDYGEYPVYGEPANPEREADAQYTYTFSGWSPELSMVIGHQSYYAQYTSTLNQYEINFYDWDGTLLQSTMVNYGEWPHYYNSDPWRESDAQYTYTFSGWSPQLDWVTGAANYYAQYEGTLNQYEITFYDWNGIVLQSELVNYGEMPTYTGVTPTREADTQYTYTFSGWSPELDMVTGHASYYAQYHAELNQYEINFYDWDGTLLQSEWVNYGEWPTYYNSDPERESDAQYTYTFTGWSPQVDIVTGHQSYYAQYTSTLNQYEINFYDWDGTLLQSTMVNYGEWPTYYNSDPWRESDAQYTYTFTGWSPELDMVTSHQAYYAQYEETLNQYEINFYDWDGELLYSDWVNYGANPHYGGNVPWRESNAQYTYTFTGWSPELSVVTGNQSYTAQYESTLNQYEINFYDWDGTSLQSEWVHYGEMPTYTGVTPTREADTQYTYTFSGWSPELDVVTEHASYYAQYEETLNQYKVTFLNWNDSVLQSTMVNYGEMPVYTGETPTKPEDVHYTYTFLNWAPEIVSVIENATYTAVYEAIEKVVTSTENSTSEPEQPRKVFMDGRLFIIRGEHIYSSQGHVIQ